MIVYVSRHGAWHNRPHHLSMKRAPAVPHPRTDRASFRMKLAEQPVFGLLQIYPNPVFAELAGLCGYDFIVIDREHGIFTDGDILATLQAVAATDMSVLVRPAGHDGQAIGRYLDMGVDGLLVPNVESAATAQALVRAMDYPPRGTRGFGAGAHRTSRYGLDVARHKADPRGEAFLAVLIESATGVAAIDEIVAVEGVDAAMIGPSDLSASLGSLGDVSVPAFGAAVSRLEAATAASGKIAGVAPPRDTPIATLIERGYRMFLLGADLALIREAMRTQLSTAKK